MMREEDGAYYYRRAEEEIARAQASEDVLAVSFHYHLAGLYLDRVFGEGESNEAAKPGG